MNMAHGVCEHCHHEHKNIDGTCSCGCMEVMEVAETSDDAKDDDADGE